MHSFLITGKNRDSVEKEIKKLADSLGLKIIDLKLNKMDDIKELTSLIKIKMFDKTAIVVRDIDKASDETQNAFLKSLEEPQENLYYILTAQSQSSPLGTIVSRCQVREVADVNQYPNAEKDSEEFISMDPGKRFEVVGKIKSRDEAVEFLTKLLYGFHSLFLKGKADTEMIESVNQSLANIQKNGNIVLQTTNLIVKLENHV